MVAAPAVLMPHTSLATPRASQLHAVSSADEPPQQAAAVRLFIGGDCATLNGQPVVLDGDRCFAANNRPQYRTAHPERVVALLDSGAFGDAPEARLTAEAALARQLAWERKAGARWGMPDWRAHAIVSYDRLIDETWVAGVKHKRRWTVGQADAAVAETVAAAAYLSSQRARLYPRTLVLSAQGVDCQQYEDCAAEVLRYARPGDWFGLGGWCILGRWRSWMPVYHATLRRVLPRVAAAGVRHVHIFGVLYRPALGALVWLADQYGLTVSTDSGAPLISAAPRDARKRKKAGAIGTTWQESVEHWRTALATLRDTPYYREPGAGVTARQLALFE